MIDFNIPPFTGKEIEYMEQAARGGKICGDGPFTKKCQAWINERFNFPARSFRGEPLWSLSISARIP